MTCCGAFEETVDQQFTSKQAGQELERYRRKGAGPTTRLLIDGLVQAGIVDGSLLDVGAGIGALTFELLDRGIRQAMIVEASAAYAAAASDEAAPGVVAQTTLNSCVATSLKSPRRCRPQASQRSIAWSVAIPCMNSCSAKQ